MAKIKDTDYLFLTTRIRVLERSLLTRERMERMLDAPTAADAAKVLQECGYPELESVTVDSINDMLSKAQSRTFDDLYFFAPDRNIIDLFRVKYDYHNAKVLLKSEARGIDAASLLVHTGRVEPKKLEEKIRSSDLKDLPGKLASAIRQARDVLGTTGDPQLSDFVLDRAYFEDIAELAEATGSQFLIGYVRLSVDIANLKSLVRTLRMGKDVDFLKGVLFSGGNIQPEKLLHGVAAGTPITDLYSASPLAPAAEVGAGCISGKKELTRFEKLCDDTVTAYLSKARYVPFGESPLITYLVAKENESTAIRIIMTGRLADLSADVIRERLREPYV